MYAALRQFPLSTSAWNLAQRFRIAALVLLLSTVSGTSPAQTTTEAPRTADERGRGELFWGGPSRDNRNVVWTLIFNPTEGAKLTHLRAEIVLLRDHGRFVRAKAADGSTLRVASKTERNNSVDLLVLTVSARKGDSIPAGPVAQVTLALQSKGPLAPMIHRFTTAQDEADDSQQPALEPPSADPPANPAGGCFFFSH